MARPCPTLPPPSADDLAQAWVRYQAHARGPNVPANLAQALTRPILARVLDASARKARTEAWLATAERRVDLVPAPQLGLDGHPMGWVTLPGLTWYAWYDTATNQPQQQNLL